MVNLIRWCPQNDVPSLSQGAETGFCSRKIGFEFAVVVSAKKHICCATTPILRALNSSPIHVGNQVRGFSTINQGGLSRRVSLQAIFTKKIHHFECKEALKNCVIIHSLREWPKKPDSVMVSGRKWTHHRSAYIIHCFEAQFPLSGFYTFLNFSLILITKLTLLQLGLFRNNSYKVICFAFYALFYKLHHRRLSFVTVRCKLQVLQLIILGNQLTPLTNPPHISFFEDGVGRYHPH